MNTKVHKVAPWIAMGMVLSVMAFAWMRESQKGERQARAHMQEDIEKIEKALQSHLQQYQDILRNANEFFSTQRLDTAAWKRYVASLHLDEKVPMLHGLGYAAYLTEENRHRRMKINPPGERFDYFVIQQIEPHEHNNALLGYDLGSELSARTAAERARDTRSAVLTGKLKLLDDAATGAFLYFYPVFRENIFQGWIFGRFREEDLLKDLFTEGASPLVLQVYEGPAMTHEALFFDSGAPLRDWKRPNSGPLTVVKGIQVAGRTWTLNFTPRPGTEAVVPSAAPGGIPLLMVVCLMALVGVICWIWMHQGAEGLAQEMMAGLRQREAALTLGPHGIILSDATRADFPVVYVNRAFEKITGYSAQEVLGKNCRFLEGTDRDQKGLQELRRALKEQRDCRVLLRNYRKDGTPFWNDLFVSPVRNDMGRVVQVVAVQQDVTEREQTARRLATEGAMIRALAESPSLYEAAPRILQAICESQEWDFGTFWQLDKRAGILQCMDQWHPLDLDIHEFENFIRQTTLTKDMGVPGTVWAKGEQVWLPDLNTETRLPEAALAVRSGLVSACGFPIASRRGLQGVLVFYSRRIWPLSKNLMLLMVGAGAQISQYMEREHVQIEQKELTILERGLAEFMGEGLIAVDREGYCIYVNVTAGRMLGHHPKILLGQHIHEILHPVAAAICDPGGCPIVLSLQSTRAVHVDDSSAFFSRKDRELLPVAYTVSPILDRDLIQGVVLTFVDTSARRAEEERLRRALAEKEEEIKRIQDMLSQTREVKNQPTPADQLVEKIRKLLG